MCLANPWAQLLFNDHFLRTHNCSCSIEVINKSVELAEFILVLVNKYTCKGLIDTNTLLAMQIAGLSTSL